MDICKSDLINHFEFQENLSSYIINKLTLSLSLVRSLNESGQLLTCVVNCDRGEANTRLCSVVQWSVHWAPSQTTQVLVLAGARRCVLETCGKKNASSAFRLG